MRGLVLLLLLIATGAHAQDHAEPLRGKDLAEFLGPVSATTITWKKLSGPDFDVYYGHANPPLSGDVGFYIGFAPSFTTPPGSKAVEGKLGIFPMKWYRAVEVDGSVRQSALIHLDRHWQADIWIRTKQMADLNRLLAIVGQLPTFTKQPKPLPFQ